jgi:hypothetical protein
MKTDIKDLSEEELEKEIAEWYLRDHWVSVRLKVDRNEAHYDSSTHLAMEAWCKENAKSNFHFIVSTDCHIGVTFMFGENDEGQAQAERDAVLFKLRWC